MLSLGLQQLGDGNFEMIVAEGIKMSPVAILPMMNRDPRGGANGTKWSGFVIALVRRCTGVIHGKPQLIIMNSIIENQFHRIAFRIQCPIVDDRA
jgi:hypothetical protein